MSERQHVMMAALAVAMQAKCGKFNDEDIANLMVCAEQYLATDDPLQRAVIGFQVQLELRPDTDALRALGADLHSQLQILSVPDPVGAARRDIHG